MSVYLHPDIVAAAIFFLDEEKTLRLAKLVQAHAKLRLSDPAIAESYVSLISEFLLREVGAEELHRLWLAYKTALRDAALYRRRQ